VTGQTWTRQPEAGQAHGRRVVARVQHQAAGPQVAVRQTARVQQLQRLEQLAHVVARHRLAVHEAGARAPHHLQAELLAVQAERHWRY